MDERQATVYASRMTRRETAAALGWLPIHIFLLPIVLITVFPKASDAELNFWIYAVGAAALMGFCLSFLRRDFDTLCDRMGLVFYQILFSYGLMLLSNLLVVQLLSLLLPPENPNNQAVLDLALGGEGAPGGEGKIFASIMVLAPILEELMFRAGIFGSLRRKNRILAYAAAMLAFSVYHVWQFALVDPMNWLFLLEYVPISFLLCRCYEKTECIWTSIFLHMLVNSVSLMALLAARGLSL